MTHLTRLDSWVGMHREELERRGVVAYTYGPAGTDNPSAHLVVALADSDVELLLWESGDAEFNRGTVMDPVFEHVEVESPEELDKLLSRFLDAVTGDVR